MTDDELQALRSLIREAVAEGVAAALATKASAKAPARGGLLTLEEAGALARVEPETVRHWIWEGRVTGYKPGRVVLVREVELLAFIEASETRRKRVAKRATKG